MNYDFELIFARKRKRMTQQQLADKAGVTRETISKLERGEKKKYAIVSAVYKAAGIEWSKSKINPTNIDND